MKCTRCGRALLSAAVRAGGMAWGPKCARIAGFLPPKARAAAGLFGGALRRARDVDTRQMCLELAP